MSFVALTVESFEAAIRLQLGVGVPERQSGTANLPCN